MDKLAMQSVLRGTAFLALLTLLPADARLYAEPLEQQVPVRPVEGEESQQPPAPALVQTIPDLDLRRTPTAPGEVEIQSEADGPPTPVGPVARLRFPLTVPRSACSQCLLIAPLQRTCPDIRAHAPPVA